MAENGDVNLVKKNLIMFLVTMLVKLDSRLNKLYDLVSSIISEDTQTNPVDSAIDAKLKAASQGVQGDPLVIEAQSYFTVLGFPVGNFGINQNGVDARFGEATEAALLTYQKIRGLEVTCKLDTTTMTDLEKVVYSNVSIRDLVRAAEAKGIKLEINVGSSRSSFVNAVYYYAILDEVNSKVPAAVTTVQAILESGYGKYVAVDMTTGKYSYNLFGIKGTGPAGSVSSWTREENPKTGIWEPVIARFKAFDSFADSIKGHSQFFYDNIKRYGSAFKTGTPADFIRAIAKAGYATDSQYATKLISLMNTWGLK